MQKITPICSSPSIASPLPRLQLRSLFVTAAILLLLLVTPGRTSAGSATWKTSPSSTDWNTAANWTPMTVPNGGSDTATFVASNQTSISLSGDVKVNGINSDAGASAFDVTVRPNRTLTISGTGITNNSGVAQNFAVAANSSGIGEIDFKGSARAGINTVFTNNGGSPDRAALIQFFGQLHG